MNFKFINFVNTMGNGTHNTALCEAILGGYLACLESEDDHNIQPKTLSEKIRKLNSLLMAYDPTKNAFSKFGEQIPGVLLSPEYKAKMFHSNMPSRIISDITTAVMNHRQVAMIGPFMEEYTNRWVDYVDMIREAGFDASIKERPMDHALPFGYGSAMFQGFIGRGNVVWVNLKDEINDIA